MGRGKLSEETKKKRALETLKEWAQTQGIELPEVKEPVEKASDLMREAQSVIYYYETRGSGFKEKECKHCGQIFAYLWNSDSINFCSLNCVAADLEKIGIKWDPAKPPAERWGKFVPAVVSPKALELLKGLDDPPEDQPL